MEFELTGLDYLAGAGVVTVTVGLPLSDGTLRNQQASFRLSDCPEIAGLFKRAVAQIGNDLVAAVEGANAVKKQESPAARLVLAVGPGITKVATPVLR